MLKVGARVHLDTDNQSSTILTEFKNVLVLLYFPTRLYPLKGASLFYPSGERTWPQDF